MCFLSKTDIGHVTSTKWRSNLLTRCQFNKITILYQDHCILSWKFILRTYITKVGMSTLHRPIHRQLYQSERKTAPNACAVITVNWIVRTFQTDTLYRKLRIQLTTFNTNQYFSILDQGKAYRQLYLSPESRHLTAFITPLGFLWVGKCTLWFNERISCFSMIHGTVFPRLLRRLHTTITWSSSRDFYSHLKHLELTLKRLWLF